MLLSILPRVALIAASLAVLYLMARETLVWAELRLAENGESFSDNVAYYLVKYARF